jgi:copper resistance protein C
MIDGMEHALNTTRRVVGLVTLAAAMALPATTTAHADLASSSPADDAELDNAPDEVRLTFTEELDPDGSGFVVTDAAAKEVGRGDVDLEVADRNELAGSVSIADPGVYTVTWAVVSSDGHEATGSYTFGYRVAEDATPDTRMVARSAPSLVFIGFLLVTASALVARRSVLGR